MGKQEKQVDDRLRIHNHSYAQSRIMGDRSRCDARLFVSFMRLTPLGLTRYFVPDKILFIKPYGQIVTGIKPVDFCVAD